MTLDQKSSDLDTRSKVIHWFRRDLRLEDNSALGAALASGAPAIPVFLLDDRILNQPTMDARRLRFLRTALIDLDRALQARGSRLMVLKTDDAPRELNRLAEETGAWSVYFNRDYTPYARARDTRATRGLQLTGVLTQLFNDRLLVEPHVMMDEDGHITPDFDNFYQRWVDLIDLPSVPPSDNTEEFLPEAGIPPSLAGWEAPWADEIATDSDDPGATPEGARKELLRFPGDELRVDLALKFGTISAREVVRHLLGRAGADATWREAADAYITRLAQGEFRVHQRFASPDPIDYPNVDITELREE